MAMCVGTVTLCTKLWLRDVSNYAFENTLSHRFISWLNFFLLNLISYLLFLTVVKPHQVLNFKIYSSRQFENEIVNPLALLSHQ